MPIIAVWGDLGVFLVRGKLAATSKSLAQLTEQRQRGCRSSFGTDNSRDSYGVVMVDTIGLKL